MRPTSLLRARLAGAAVVLAAACGGAFAADSPWLYGIHWFGPASNASDVSQMTGGKNIWDLETVMTNDGAGDWGPQGQFAKLQQVAALGHTLIIRVQPVWGKAFPLPGDTAPSMAQFLDQVTQTVTLYKDICHIWLLGNEMNLLFEWGGQQLMPENYIDGAVQFSDRVKAVTSSLGPQIVLVGPAAAGDQTDSQKFMGWTEYASRMCDRINATGVRSKFDGFAMHAYGALANQDLNAVLQEFETTSGSGYQSQIGLLDSKGFASCPVYITEWNRYTGSSTDEWVSAQFLYTALARMNAWNQSHHPVVCACWFVYPSEYGWPEWSIRALKSNDAYDHDLWHAFQYAAGFNYPAGFFHTPVIGLSTTGWSRSVVAGLNVANDTFTVRNVGVGTLSYTISDDSGWLSCSPTAGASTGEADTITVSYSTAGLAVGTYQATITVADPGAVPTSRTVSVDLRVKPIPGDFDGDDDVDQQDFGSFQVCYTGAGVVQSDPACEDADLDGDTDVDSGDFSTFQVCFSGPHVPASPHCAGDRI